jgi:hypothetical protein
MKIRFGFVSNSSDASFAIPLKFLSPFQIEAIIRYATIGEMLDIPYADDGWSIQVTPTHIIGDTNMDNFDMDTLFEYFGIPEKVVHKGSACGHWNCSEPPSWAKGDEREEDPRMWEWSEDNRFEPVEVNRFKMTDKEFFVEFLRTKDFEFLEKLAARSENVRKMLADPDFKVGNNED